MLVIIIVFTHRILAHSTTDADHWRTSACFIMLVTGPMALAQTLFMSLQVSDPAGRRTVIAAAAMRQPSLQQTNFGASQSKCFSSRG